MTPLPTRRAFCTSTAAALACRVLHPGHLLAQPNSTHPDVASIDHDRILHAADRYLADAPAPITSLPAPNSPGTPHDYFSEASTHPDADPDPIADTRLFTAHRDALFALGLRVPALAAAHHLTADPKYIQAAALHLRAWFISPETRLNPSLDFAQVPTAPDTTSQTSTRRVGSYTGILETLPFVEIIQSIPFLATALTPADLTGLQHWFAAYLSWLTAEQDSGPRLAALARDSKDHHASSWLLQTAAYTLFTAPENGAPKNETHAMTELRHRFRSVTLRTQISPEGTFRNEIDTPNPYRNSLFNLDLLACACQLLSTRFESAWDYQLEDGPGMRVAVAFHARYIQDRGKWPYRADLRYFTDLPSRRPTLLFAARAYQRPEYATLWRTLAPDPAPPEINRSLPIHQPLLWTTQPRRQPSETPPSALRNIVPPT